MTFYGFNATKTTIDHSNVNDPTTLSITKLMNYDFVITTFDTVRQEGEQLTLTEDEFRTNLDTATRGNFPLFVVNWQLVALDEAHRIANPRALVTEAVCRLRSKYRIASTDTPFSNEYSDCQSTMRFLGIKPWIEKHLFNQLCSLSTLERPWGLEPLTRHSFSFRDL
jgi:SNF2 family DNA or RNA helicase